jgi:hypothetical protein
MAWVVSIEKKLGQGRMQPTHVTAHVKVFDLPDSSPVVQIDTNGSSNRAAPGKQSQTLQFGREAAEQLYRVLRDTYKFES